MVKPKLDIRKNQLSWEKTNYRKCDKINCNEKGEFKAPKSRVLLNQYFFFCLKHVKEYNKSWDFYKGLSVDQIETSMREDIIWNRPSWPLKGNSQNVIDQIDTFFSQNFDDLTEKSNNDSYFINKIKDHTLTPEDNKALGTLGLKLPISLNIIKKSYKKLVKSFHHDVNGNNKRAEEKFKEISKAYKMILNKFKNKQTK